MSYNNYPFKKNEVFIECPHISFLLADFSLWWLWFVIQVKITNGGNGAETEMTALKKREKDEMEETVMNK